MNKMKTLVILALAVAAVLAAPSEDRTGRIVGGSAAVRGNFPYIVSLQWVIIGVSQVKLSASFLQTI